MGRDQLHRRRPGRAGHPGDALAGDGHGGGTRHGTAENSGAGRPAAGGGAGLTIGQARAKQLRKRKSFLFTRRPGAAIVVARAGPPAFAPWVLPRQPADNHEENPMHRARPALLLAAVLIAGSAYAADDAIRLVMRDGKFDPAVVEVPAGKRFKLEVVNEGKKAMEFESKDLKQEKVIAPGKSATVTINALKPGEYKFYDEFNEATGQGKVVAR
jgi:plastocyanin